MLRFVWNGNRRSLTETLSADLATSWIRFCWKPTCISGVPAAGKSSNRCSINIPIMKASNQFGVCLSWTGARFFSTAIVGTRSVRRTFVNAGTSSITTSGWQSISQTTSSSGDGSNGDRIYSGDPMRHRLMDGMNVDFTWFSCVRVWIVDF